MDSFWSVANALKDAVKQQTADLTASLKNTDWKSEMGALQEGLKEDTAEISQKAKEVTEDLGHKTIEVAKNLPQVVDETRRKAVAQLEQLPSSSAATAKEVSAHLQQASASITKISQKVVTNTSEIIDHFSSAIQAEMAAAQDGMTRSHSTAGSRRGGAPGSDSSSKFSRFDADVAAMQRDSSTYCDEPEDAEDFEAWSANFDLPGRRPDIAKLLGENTFMSELQARIVPVVVDYDSFWTRYFYRLHKLEEKHAKVAALTQRAQSNEEPVGWDSEEEEEEEEEAAAAVVAVGMNKAEEAAVNEPPEEKEELVAEAVALPEEAPSPSVAKESKNKVESGENADLIEEVVVEEGQGAAGEEQQVTAAGAEDGEAGDSAEEKDSKKKNKDEKSKPADLDDDMSSLDLSGGEDAGPAGEDDDDDSDWGVSEWE